METRIICLGSSMTVPFVKMADEMSLDFRGWLEVLEP